MKTPDEIKKGLYVCYVCPDGRKCNECPYFFDDERYCDCNPGTDALAYIQQLEANQPKWISTEERLPEICDLVLVIASGKPKENVELIDAVIIASYWGDEGWIADGFDGWDKLNVTRWMPLPELPKEE